MQPYLSKLLWRWMVPPKPKHCRTLKKNPSETWIRAAKFRDKDKRSATRTCWQGIWNLHFGTSVLWKLWKRQLPALGRSFDSEFSVNCQLHGDWGKLLNKQSAWGLWVMKIWLLAKHSPLGDQYDPYTFNFKLTILTVWHARWKSTLVFWGSRLFFF